MVIDVFGAVHVERHERLAARFALQHGMPEELIDRIEAMVTARPGLVKKFQAADPRFLIAPAVEFGDNCR
jgi:hypothetical protein